MIFCIFKQKTAYEMRISDWSSDVCSSDLNETQQFHLITDQPLNKLHSQLDHSPISKGGKIHGREPVVIHKADAQRLNLLDGDIVRVFTQRGACLATVVLTENLRQGVVKISTGAWFDPPQMAHGQWLDVHGNPTVLNLDKVASALPQDLS